MMRKTLRQLASSVLSATTSSRGKAARFASYSASNGSNVFKSATAIGCPSPSFATRSRYRETISRPRLTRCSTSIALRHHLVCTLIQAPRRANDRSAIRDVLTRRGGGPKNRRRGVTERAGPAMSALLIEKPHFLIKNTAMPETIVRFPATGTIPPPPDELAEAGRELWTKVISLRHRGDACGAAVFGLRVRRQCQLDASADQGGRRDRHRLDRPADSAPVDRRRGRGAEARRQFLASARAFL